MLVAWVAYDMALHGYALMIPAVGYALYFTSVVAADNASASMWWAIAVALPLLVSGLLAPLLGTLADARGSHRGLLVAATALCAAATAALTIPGYGEVGKAIGVFAIAHLAFLLAGSLYNAYLPRLLNEGNVSRISGLGWGLSYFGSIACLLLCLPFVGDGIVPGSEARYALALSLQPASWPRSGCRRSLPCQYRNRSGNAY